MNKYTSRQLEVLARIGDEDAKNYQKTVYDSAHELFRMIKDEKLNRITRIVKDLRELAKHQAGAGELSKAKEYYDPIAIKMNKKLGGCSNYSCSCTIIELKSLISDFIN